MSLVGTRHILQDELLNMNCITEPESPSNQELPVCGR